MGSGLKIDVSRLALLPIAYLAEQDIPSDRFAPEAQLDSAYRDVVTISLWAYLLHSYLELVRKCFGDRVARLVRAHQRSMLESALAGSAALVESALDLIYSVRKAGCINTPGQWTGVEFAAELDISMTLLLGLPGSPDYLFAERQVTDRIVHKKNGIDLVLARLLASHESQLLQTLSPVFDRAAVDSGLDTLQ